jgi:hypothetical protein
VSLDRTFATKMVRRADLWIAYYLPCLILSPCVSVLAAQSIANVVKSSLGPMGLDKMLVDNIGVRSLSRRRYDCQILNEAPYLCRK